MSRTDNGTELRKFPTESNGYVSDDKSEKDKLLAKNRRVSAKTAVQLRTGALIISWISLVTTLIQGIIALVFAVREGSASILGFGIDAILDSLTSIVVLWRFYSTELYSERRERRACVMIGVLFTVSSLFLAGKISYSFVHKRKPSKESFLWILSVVNGCMNLVLGLSKLLVGYKLESKALMADSVVTLVGSVASFSAVAAIYLYLHDYKLWYIDDLFGILCSVFLLIYAIILFVLNCSSLRQTDN